MKHRRQGMGFGLVIIALLFFFNPNINIIDPLPDWIGYVLLCCALSRLSDLNDSVESATRGFRKMILIDGAKWIALLWVFGLSIPGERNSSLLLWSFVFATLELIVLIPTWSKLFHGLTQLGYLYQNTAVFGNKEGKRSRTDKIRNLTAVFVSLKAVLSVLPEFADLSNTYGEEVGMLDLYRHIGVMRMLAFIPVLVVGIIWLWRSIRYFCALRGDTVFMGALREQYTTEILPKKGLFIRRHTHWLCFVFVTALCLTIDFRLEYRNVLPDTLAAIMFFVVLYFLANKLKITRMPAWIACGVYLVCTVFSYGTEWRFFNEFSYHAIRRSNEARDAYMWVIVAVILKAVAFALLAWLLVKALRTLIAEHTGYVAGREWQDDRAGKLVHAVHKELNRSLTVALIGTALYVCIEIVYVFLAPSFGFMGVTHIVFAILCVLGFARALFAIRNAVDTKYMLE